MTPETLARVSWMVGRQITSWRDLTGIEIEAFLNDWARANAHTEARYGVVITPEGMHPVITEPTS